MDRNTSVGYLGLGSNLGDRLAAMQSAVRALQEHPHIDVDLDDGVASLYETSPVGEVTEQAWFLNSAVRITTDLSPEALLTEVLYIEAALGRTRPDPHGTRVIDIDILLCADSVMTSEHLTLPHPRMHRRRFVLEPLSEIAPNVLHPVIEITVGALARRRRDEPTAETVVRIADRSWHRTPAIAGPTRIASGNGSA